MAAGHSAVQYVGFGLTGDEDHRRDGHAAITSYELFSANGQPVKGGGYDLRMGTTDHAYTCTTCGHGKKLCPGHSGFLALRVAVPQPIAIAEIRRWLKVACFACGNIVVEPEKYAGVAPARRLAEAASVATEGKRCPVCGELHPKIVKDDEDYFTFRAEPVGAAVAARGASAADRQRYKLYPDAIRAILARIPDSAVEALGRGPEAAPSKLILRVIKVPPNTIRPGVRRFGGTGSSYHDSTNLLQHLVKRNQILPEVLPEQLTATTGSSAGAARGAPAAPRGEGAAAGARSPEGDLDRSVQNLQETYYAMILGSASTSVTQGNSGRRGLVIGQRPPSSFMRNLPRKEGRIRAGLLGKRVLYISRSTISGNMRLRIDEVGVPLWIVRTLQVEETVQEYNRDWLMPFFLNGRRQYPGCTHVVKRATGETHDVAGLKDFRLEVGDKLYRDGISGDLAFFNRQPTLERCSIGVHRVVVIQDPSVHTFQMNVLACENYNADFDGDQMNMWLARGPGARAEAAIMSGVANWFISTKTSGPVNGEVQDSVVGSYLLTRAARRLDKYHAMALFAQAGVEPPRFDALPDDHVYTGREIASLLFGMTPINYRRPPTSFSDVYAPYIPYDPEETLTVFEQGRMTRGVLDARAIGAKSTGGLFHLISRGYGSRRALDMVYAEQQIVLQLMLYSGFTVAAADLIPPPAAREQIGQCVASVELESELITQRLLRGEIVPPIGLTVHEFYEELQRAALQVNTSEVMRWILGAIRPDTNGLFVMIATKSKGSNPNMIHISGAIGQTTINAERIREQFDFRRTLAYFPRFATSPAAYGFVPSCYVTGMTASEFIFQGMNGRFDLINKALSTASTGYFMRKGVMNNQSSVVDNRRRVVKDTRIVQLVYGDDGLDARELERVSFRTTLLSDDALRAFAAPAAPLAAAPKALQEAVDAAVAKIREDRDMYRECFMRIESSNFNQAFSTELLMPVNVERIVQGVLATPAAAAPAPAAAPEGAAAALLARIERVWQLCADIPYALLNEIQERRRGRVPPHLTAAASLLCMLIRAELSPKVLALLSDAQLEWIVGAVRQRYSLSLVDYGTSVGTLAAQAISEPLTQYMLDSHHRSVAGGTNKAGLTRVSEIYGARPVAEEQSTAMLLPLLPETTAAAAGDPLAVAQDIANSIEYVTLRRFVSRYDVLLEPYSALVYPAHAGDRQWIDEFERAHPLIRPPGNLTNWVFRFVLDKSSLVLKAVSLELIVGRLRRLHPGVHVVHTPEAVPEVVVRVWHRETQFKRGYDARRSLDLLEAAALDTPIRGIPGIVRATAERLTRRCVTAGGETVDAESDTLISGDPASAKKTRKAVSGELLKAESYAIRTMGTNLYRAMLHAAVDRAAVISSSIGDTEKVLGIEAAQAKIINETRAFMEENTPNLRHIALYASEMTRTGRVTSIERAGLGAREHGNVLLRMAYGSPIQVVTDAALSGVRSKVYGVAAPALLGSVPQIGTLYNQLVVDEEFVQANVKSVDSILDSL